MIGKIVLDISLVVGFGVVHSSLASFRSKELGKIIFSASRYRLLFSVVTAIYILVAAYYWQVIPVLIYAIPSPFSGIFKLVVLMGWFMYFFSHLAYYEVGGVFGTSQLFAQSKLIKQARFDYSTNGLKKYLRFPVHSAFFLMFLFIPQMYASTLIFAFFASMYAWLGTIHHDFRYSKIFKKNYEEYKKYSGMVLPKFNKGKLIGYPIKFVDQTQRKKSLSLTLTATLLMMVTNFFMVINYKSLIIHDKLSLFFVPVMVLISGITSIIISLIIIRKFKINCDPTANLEKSESVAFGCGCAIALSLAFTYLTVGYLFSVFPNFAAIIPAWVLALLAMHGVYFAVELVVLKLKSMYAGILS